MAVLIFLIIFIGGLALFCYIVYKISESKIFKHFIQTKTGKNICNGLNILFCLYIVFMIIFDLFIKDKYINYQLQNHDGLITGCLSRYQGNEKNKRTIYEIDGKIVATYFLNDTPLMTMEQQRRLKTKLQYNPNTCYKVQYISVRYLNFLSIDQRIYIYADLSDDLK